MYLLFLGLLDSLLVWNRSAKAAHFDYTVMVPFTLIFYNIIIFDLIKIKFY